MRITPQLSAGVVAVGLVVFGVDAIRVVSEERRSLDVEIARELLLLGGGLRVSIEHALHHGQSADVADTVRKINALGPAIDVQVFGPEFQGSDVSTINPAARALMDEALAQNEPRMLVSGPQAPELAMYAAPLVDRSGTQRGAVVLVRPIHDVLGFLAGTTRTLAMSGLLFVAAAMTLGHLLGTRYITRPLARLTEAIRSVRRGEYDHTLQGFRHDEVGEVAEEFRLMQADLRSARERLRVEEERRRELLLAIEEADKLVTIGQLSASLAHEIGSPLQVLHGRARALALSPGDEEKTRRNAEILVRETERIARIVDQLLSVARRRPQPNLTRVDVGNAVREVVELLEIEARRRKVSLETEIAEECTLRADGDQLRQILLNLSTNALAASRPGGRVRLSATPVEEGGIRLLVVDDGVGMDEGVAARAFEPLFTTRPLEGGRGLGLAVVHSIVQDQGGHIDLRSSPGFGTQVSVFLPDRPELPKEGTS